MDSDSGMRAGELSWTSPAIVRAVSDVSIGLVVVVVVGLLGSYFSVSVGSVFVSAGGAAMVMGVIAIAVAFVNVVLLIWTLRRGSWAHTWALRISVIHGTVAVFMLNIVGGILLYAVCVGLVLSHNQF
jgi:small-conductance mechanosensitive channel